MVSTLRHCSALAMLRSEGCGVAWSTDPDGSSCRTAIDVAGTRSWLRAARSVLVISPASSAGRSEWVSSEISVQVGEGLAGGF